MGELERLHEAVAAVCPVAGVSRSRAGALSFHALPQATGAQVAAAQAVLEAFDWSGEAQAAWERSRHRDRAKALKAAQDSPEMVLLRNALRVIYASVAQCRAKVNELVADHNARTGGTITPLAANRTWPQLLQAVDGAIDQETDPGA